MNESLPAAEARPRYLWPWFVAAAVVTAIIIAIFSIRAEANRIKQQRSPQIPQGQSGL